MGKGTGTVTQPGMVVVDWSEGEHDQPRLYIRRFAAGYERKIEREEGRLQEEDTREKRVGYGTVEVEEDSMSWGKKYERGGKFSVAGTHWFCSTDSRLLGSLTQGSNFAVARIPSFHLFHQTFFFLYYKVSTVTCFVHVYRILFLLFLVSNNLM